MILPHMIIFNFGIVNDRGSSSGYWVYMYSEPLPRAGLEGFRFPEPTFEKEIAKKLGIYILYWIKEKYSGHWDSGVGVIRNADNLGISFWNGFRRNVQGRCNLAPPCSNSSPKGTNVCSASGRRSNKMVHARIWVIIDTAHVVKGDLVEPGEWSIINDHQTGDDPARFRVCSSQ